MKSKIALAATIGIVTLSACSQEIPQSEIPSVVLNTFNMEFVNATDVEWEKKGALYEVEFEINNQDHEALVDEAGTLTRYKKELKLIELPENIKTSLNSNQSNQKIDDVHFLVVGEDNYYQVELDGRLTDSKKVYNEAGEEMKDVVYFD